MSARKRWTLVTLALAALLPLSTDSIAAQQGQAPSASRTARDDGESFDLSKLAPFPRAVYLSARKGMEWLWQANRPDGLFVYGYVPALNTLMEGDNYLSQAGAAFALARAARFTGDSRYTARARQAVLALLASTRPDPNDARARTFTFPSTQANRLGSAGVLVLAINELPQPAEDLLEQSEQLCLFIRNQQQPDGSLKFHEGAAEAGTSKEGIDEYPGPALYALMRSQPYRPAAWKTEVLRKALTFYRPWWQKNRSLAFVGWQTAAYAEANLLTREKPFADFVFEMGDWLCSVQLGLEARNPVWQGGFAHSGEHKARLASPGISSASCANALAEACRVARQAGDVPRFGRYRDAAERGLQFIMMLQYSTANTSHFADAFQPRLVGAFHASHQNGDLRVDDTQQAVRALVQYLQYVAEVPARTVRGG